MCFQRGFTALVILAQLLGIGAVAMTATWMAHFRGGFAWNSNPSLEFNYHPLFMVIGMVFLYAEGILTYRVFRYNRKIIVKILHACMHVGALVFSGVGMKAVFDKHNLSDPPIPNLFTLHSWLGLFVVACFGLQWLFGFACFLLPTASKRVRSMYLPYHVFCGIALLVLATGVTLVGITENALFLMDQIHYSQRSPESYLLNFLGVVLVLFTGTVVYIVSKPEFKRESSEEPDETSLTHLQQ